MNMNQINTHALREVVEDSLYSLVMWIDEAYAYDSRQLEEIPCDDVAANYLATIACCLATNNTKEEISMHDSHIRYSEMVEREQEEIREGFYRMPEPESPEPVDYTHCRGCGGEFGPDQLTEVHDGPEVYFVCDVCFDKLYFEDEQDTEYEDEAEAGRHLDEKRNEEFARWLKARK